METNQLDLSHIKKIPTWWKYVPFLSTDMAATFHPFIYFPLEVFNNLKSDNPDDLSISILVHGMSHLNRQQKKGPFKWCLVYLFSRKFRLQEELEAVRVQMIYLMSHQKEYDFDKKAKQFSSGAYLWMISYEKGLKMLKHLWEDLSL